MRILLILLTVMALLTSCACSTVEVLDGVMDVDPKLRKAYCSSLTVTVVGVSSGSGTLINYDDKVYILSVWHLAKEDDVSPYISMDRVVRLQSLCLPEDFQAMIIRFDTDKDLMLMVPIDTEMDLSKYATEIADKAPMLGQELWAIGSPLGKTLGGAWNQSISHGILSNKVIRGGTLSYKTGVPLFFGSSGGGLFNNKMRVVGVAQGFRAQHFFGIIPDSYYYVSHEEISSFLPSAIELP